MSCLQVRRVRSAQRAVFVVRAFRLSWVDPQEARACHTVTHSRYATKPISPASAACPRGLSSKTARFGRFSWHEADSFERRSRLRATTAANAPRIIAPVRTKAAAHVPPVVAFFYLAAVAECCV